MSEENVDTRLRLTKLLLEAATNNAQPLAAIGEAVGFLAGEIDRLRMQLPQKDEAKP